MAEGTHSVTLDVPINDIWGFVSQMDKWTPLVPGYIEHEMINDRQSIWTLEIDVGIMTQSVKLQVDIIEWNEPTRIAFNLLGVDENVAGAGYFEAEQIAEATTTITGSLSMEAKGIMGSIMNEILNSLVPDMTKKLTETIGQKITDTYET